MCLELQKWSNQYHRHRFAKIPKFALKINVNITHKIHGRPNDPSNGIQIHFIATSSYCMSELSPFESILLFLMNFRKTICGKKINLRCQYNLVSSPECLSTSLTHALFFCPAYV